MHSCEKLQRFDFRLFEIFNYVNSRELCGLSSKSVISDPLLLKDAA